MVIYKITNTINERIYIGQTVGTLGKRWNEHSTSKKNSPMYNAFRAHGRDNFKMEAICSVLDPSYLNELEQYFIKYYNSMAPTGYNLTSGGDSAYRRSEESREKQRRAMTGRLPTEETRAKISQTLMGRPGVRRGAIHTDEARAKISKAGVGRVHSEDTRAKMKAAHAGANAYNAKKVLCIETGQIFGSSGEAARVLNLKQSSISAVCTGNRRSTGGKTFKHVE